MQCYDIGPIPGAGPAYIQAVAVLVLIQWWSVSWGFKLRRNRPIPCAFEIGARCWLHPGHSCIEKTLANLRPNPNHKHFVWAKIINKVSIKYCSDMGDQCLK